jgi:hypothetical protein
MFTEGTIERYALNALREGTFTMPIPNSHTEIASRLISGNRQRRCHYYIHCHSTCWMEPAAAITDGSRTNGTATSWMMSRDTDMPAAAGGARSDACCQVARCFLASAAAAAAASCLGNGNDIKATIYMRQLRL